MSDDYCDPRRDVHVWHPRYDTVADYDRCGSCQCGERWNHLTTCRQCGLQWRGVPRDCPACALVTLANRLIDATQGTSGGHQP